MKKSFFLGFAIIVILMALVSACSEATTSPTTSAPAPNDEMKTLITERCSTCHSVDIVFTANFSQNEWSSLIDLMIERGAIVTMDEKAMMIDWLVANQ